MQSKCREPFDIKISICAANISETTLHIRNKNRWRPLNWRTIWNGRRLSGCGTQHPHRALGGTRVLLAAAPTTPPCFRHWRRSSSLLAMFSGKSIFILLPTPAGRFDHFCTVEGACVDGVCAKILRFASCRHWAALPFQQVAVVLAGLGQHEQLLALGKALCGCDLDIHIRVPFLDLIGNSLGNAAGLCKAAACCGCSVQSLRPRPLPAGWCPHPWPR